VAQEKASKVIRSLFPLFFVANMFYATILIFFPKISNWIPDLIAR
jgi:TRAP-type C4-dicarboxylate transport system permease large subunit